MIILVKPISKDQVNYIRENCDKQNPPHINITSRRKKNGKTYYIEETRQVERLLKDFDNSMKNKITEGRESNK